MNHNIEHEQMKANENHRHSRNFCRTFGKSGGGVIFNADLDTYNEPEACCGISKVSVLTIEEHEGDFWS